MSGLLKPGPACPGAHIQHGRVMSQGLWHVDFAKPTQCPLEVEQLLRRDTLTQQVALDFKPLGQPAGKGEETG